MSTKLFDISNWCRHGHEVEDYPYIGEIDIDLSIGEVVNVDGNYYAPGVINHRKNSAGVRLIQLNINPDDKDFTNNVTCPYCGFVELDSWELEDDDDGHICGRCGAIISYHRVVNVEYNSSPKSPPEIINANWKSK